MEQVKKREDEIEAIAAGIGPVLDNISLPQPEGPRLPGDPTDRPSTAAVTCGQTLGSSLIAWLMGPSIMPSHSYVRITRQLTCSGLQLCMRKVQMCRRL
jgi:hypothetical protein